MGIERQLQLLDLENRQPFKNGSGETIIYSGKMSKMSYLPWLILPAFVGVFFFISLLNVIIGKNSLIDTVVPFTLFEFIVSVPFLNAYLRSLVAGVMVTDKRVIYKSGVFTRITLEQYLSKIESCEIEQSIMGRLLDYGTIIITGTGGTSIRMPGLDAPQQMREQVIAALSLAAQNSKTER